MSTTEELRNFPPHGQKRSPEDDLEGEQRLAKRFNLLNLEQHGKFYLPAQKPPQPVRRSRSNAFSDSMHVDDSRERIYIHNIDEELADTNSDDEKLIFLPDIEKRLTKIPHAVLASEPPPKAGNEMVLYSVPTSITVPREHDNVRKAIIESRQRARDQALESEYARREDAQIDAQSIEQGNISLSSHSDPDAMDLS